MAADSTVTRKLVVDGKQVENTFRDLNSAANKLRREMKNLEEGTEEYAKKSKELQKISPTLNKIRKDMRGLGQEQQKTGNLFGKLTKGIKLGGATIVGVVLAISAAFVNVVKDAFAATTEVNKLRKSLNQLTGETGEDLDTLTAKTKALADAFDKDLNEVTAAANNLSKQMGISFEESLDLIQKGFIKGADSQDDFLNKVKEYPVQFKNSGLSAEEFIQIATQEARGGVFDDKLLDTVKELGLRLRQLTPTAQAALDLLGEGFSKELQQDINSGTVSTIEAFEKITARAKELGLTTSQTQTIIADLGAGALEDLGGLEEATKQLNAAQELNLDTLTESEQAQKTQIELIEQRARAENELAKETRQGAAIFKNLQIQFQTFVTKGITLVVKGINQVIEFFKNLYENSVIVRGAIEVLGFAFRTAFNIIVGIVKTAVGVIKQTFGVLADIISLDFESLGNRIQKAFSLSTDTIISQTQKLKREVKQNLENIDLSKVPPQFRKAFEKAAEEAKKGLETGIGGEALTSSFLNNALKGLSAVVKEIPESVNSIIEQVNQGVVSVEQGITSITKALNEQGFTDNQITKFIDQLGPQFEEAKQKQKQLFAAQQEAQKKQLETLKNAREKARQEELASQKAIQDLRIEVMEEGFEKESARLKLQRERELEEVKGSEEQKRQQILLINQRFDQEQDKLEAERKEEQKQKEEEEFQEELENIDLKEEERQLKLEEKFINGLETEKTRQEAFLDLEKEFLNQRLTLLQEAGKGETSEAFEISKQLLDIQKKRQEQEVANEELTRKAKEQIRELDFATAKNFVGLFTSLAGESAAAQKFALIAEAFEAIASIKINTAKSIVAFRASPLGILVPGAAEAFAAKAKIQSGIAIGQVLAAKATQFFARDGGIFRTGGFVKKLSKGGVPAGPSHAQGGIGLIDNRTGRTLGEMEGREPIMILSKNTYRNNGEVIDRLLNSSTQQNGAPIFQQGGIIGESPASSASQEATGSTEQSVEQSSELQLELINRIDALIIVIEENAQSFRSVRAVVDTVQLVDELEDTGTVVNEANF